MERLFCRPIDADGLVRESLSPARSVVSLPCMTPQAALETQISRYRAMSREQRVGIALRLHELACEMARMGIRRQNPQATASEIEELLRRRLELVRTL